LNLKEGKEVNCQEGETGKEDPLKRKWGEYKERGKGTLGSGVGKIKKRGEEETFFSRSHSDKKKR